MFKLVVLFSVLALAAAKPGVVLPLGYGALPAVSSVSQYSVYGSVLPYSAAYSPLVSAWPYVAQPPHTPAVVLDPVHGVPLDTPEVVAARAAHYQAKALAGVHHLAKRSAVLAPVAHSLVSPLAYSTYGSPYVSTYGSPYWSSWAAPYGLGYSAVVPKALSVHPY